jgi:nicotinate dehydrogenase subunit B
MNAPFKPRFTRRKVLAGGGSLALAFSVPASAFAQAPAAPAAPRLPGDLQTNRKLSMWLRIEAGGKIRLLLGKVELGQGILTAVQQVCAEELCVDFNRIVITSGDTSLVPNEGVTAGSLSMPGCGTAVRHASADARGILVSLAAEKLGVDAGKLDVTDGMISGDGKQITYWELVSGQEFEVEASAKTPLRARDKSRYIGKNIPRIDIPAKMTGQPIYVQDLRPDGMVHGRIVRLPVYDAKLVSADLATIEKLPGVLRVVRDGSFLGVIAEREEQAIRAADTLRRAAQWDVPKDVPTSETVYDWMQKQKLQNIVIKNEPRKDRTAAAATIEVEYRRPFHMHASIGPSCALATLDADGMMTIQTHSQSVFETRNAIAMMLGVDREKVRCQHVQGSGCYGHNGADDVAADAALLARALPGRPVRVQWSRNDEHKWEPYGAAMLTRIKAGVDGNGNVLDWDYQLWSTSHGTRPSNDAGNLLAGQVLEKPFPLPTPVNAGGPNYAADRNAIAMYEFPGQVVTTHFITTFAARASSTRGLGAYANVFSIESFMDELAHRAKVDPVEYRLRVLKNERARAVLQKAADNFGWANWRKTPNRGRGIAYAMYKNLATYCAIAIEVEVDRATGKIRVLRAVAATDSGEVVSPDGVKNQIEGGIVQSLSWSLKEAVRFDAGGVHSDDWISYPILTFSEIPKIEIELIDRPGQPFLGAGEASQGPTGAALANAVFDAVGVRYRELPLTPSKVKLALQS